jgi:hypothetical protein
MPVALWCIYEYPTEAWTGRETRSEDEYIDDTHYILGGGGLTKRSCFEGSQVVPARPSGRGTSERG